MDMQRLLDAVIEQWVQHRPLLPLYFHIILSAVLPIYTGAHASLSRPSSAAKPTKKSKSQETVEYDDEEEAVQKMESLSAKDAIVFPIMAAMVLAALYFLINRYGAALINAILNWYFAAVGVYSLASLINDALTVGISFIFPTYFSSQGKLWRVDGSKRQSVAVGPDGKPTKLDIPTPLVPAISKSLSNILWTCRAATKQPYITKAYIASLLDFKARLTVINFFSAISGVGGVIYASFIARPWWLVNLQGFAVCYSAMQLLSPTSFSTGSLILAGLFFYDIWAVFFTPLMVTVAKNLDQPIKMVFPRPDEPSSVPGEPPVKSYSMLGLGDIVLPGIMIGLALRFDLYMYYLKMQKSTVSTSEDGEKVTTLEKAQYVPITGYFGDRFWTMRIPNDLRPERLRTHFPKPYFTASMIGYVVGMVTTLIVMSVFQHAQPALLYLVPGVLISVWGTGLVRGELAEMQQFSEGLNAEQLDDQESKEKDSAQKARGNADLEVKDVHSFLRKLWDKPVPPASDQAATEQCQESKTKEEPANNGTKDAALKSEQVDQQATISDTIIAFSIVRSIAGA